MAGNGRKSILLVDFPVRSLFVRIKRNEDVKILFPAIQKLKNETLGEEPQGPLS